MIKVNKKYLIIFSILFLLISCSPSNNVPTSQLISEYYRGVKENCYLNPVTIISSGPVFLTQEYCDIELQKSKDEKFYEQNKISSSLEEAYYLGLSDGCNFNPIGADQNDNFIFRTEQYCNSWVAKMKKLKIFEQNITSENGVIQIPDFLKTPQIEPIGTRVKNTG